MKRFAAHGPMIEDPRHGSYVRFKDVPSWKSVKNEMPEEDGKYLCHFSDGEIETFTWSGDGYENDPWGVLDIWVTHWMELPDPPK